MKKVVIVGAKGSGKDILATILRCNEKSKIFKVLGFIDDDPNLKHKEILGKKVLGGLNWFDNNKDKIFCVVAIGDSFIRKKIIRELESKNVNFLTLIDPSVIFSKDVKIGVGSIIQAGSIINPDTIIGKHVFINLDSTIGHDCILEDFVTISTGVHINGTCIVKEGAYVSTGVVTLPNTKIGKWSVVGAGSIVINELKSNSVYIGNPAKISRKISSKNRPKL